MKIEGIATFSEKGFHFDSGIPSNEPVLEMARKMRGTMVIGINGCADFTSSPRVILPPEVSPVAKSANYNIKRTTRHYIVQIKVPVVETRKTTQDTLNSILPAILGDITLDRKELIK